MRILVIISGILFVAGNAFWKKAHEPKLFWIPLGVFLWTLVTYVCFVPKDAHPVIKYLLFYLATLASGNILKQSFYSEGLLQINDYVWGGLVTVGLILMIIRWAILNRQTSGKK